MDKLLSNIKISINNKIFIKDPESSELGKRIIENSIILIDDIGFDSFTFKKLGIKISSNESSIYRYFENKHKLLLYLTSWYWSWLEYQLVFATHSIHHPRLKLEIAINILTQTTIFDTNFKHINEVVLKQIIINEYSKSYLTKEVDTENKEGYFETFKRLVSRLKDMIQDLNPEYKFAFSLSNTVIDGALHQQFIKDHFSSISNNSKNYNQTDYFKQLVFNTLNAS